MEKKGTESKAACEFLNSSLLGIMRANRKWTVRAVTLVLMALVAAGIVLWDFGNPYDKQKFVEAQETTPEEAFELSAWSGICVSSGGRMSRRMCITCFCPDHSKRKN